MRFGTDESPEDASHRELGEEPAVFVTAAGDRILPLEDPGSVFPIEFTAVTIEGDAVAVEHGALQWVSLSELSALSLAPSEARFAAHLLKENPGR